MTETIPALFARHASTFGPRPLFYVKRSGAYQPISWQQTADQILALSAFLLHEHVETGDRVLIFSENRPEWGIADLAIQSVGAWTVPIYATLTAQDLLTICRDCQPTLAFVSDTDHAQKLLEITQHVPSLRAILVFNAPAPQHALVRPWSDALEQGRAVSPQLQGLLEHRQGQLHPDQTATLIYTSGTTGEPKGVMLSHDNFLSNVRASLEITPITSADLYLSFLPLSHSFERMAGWYLMLSAGASVAYAESMDTIPDNMREVRPTVMLGMPRFFEKLYTRVQEHLRDASPLKQRIARWSLNVGRAVKTRQAQHQPVPLGLTMCYALADRVMFRTLRSRLGGRLRFFVSGSAPLAKEIGEFFYAIGITILEGYGLTETSPVITVNRLSNPRFGTVGPPIPGVEVRIAEDGEILTRGPHVMQGYYRNPDATAATIVDGWLHTGDIGHLDAEGCLVITDRKKDLIKTAGGKYVAPQKLENLLVTDPYISQAFVYGDTRPYCVALVVPRMEALQRYASEQKLTSSSTAELVKNPRITQFYWERVQAAQQHLPHFEQVKKIAVLDHEFSLASGELTPTLKAKRAIIAKRYDALLSSLYSTTT